jgi:hypothetical protein
MERSGRVCAQNIWNIYFRTIVTGFFLDFCWVLTIAYPNLFRLRLKDVDVVSHLYGCWVVPI